MAAKTGIDSLALSPFYVPAQLEAAKEGVEPARTEIQALAQCIQIGNSHCVAMMALDCDEEVYELSMLLGQEWARRAKIKICVVSELHRSQKPELEHVMTNRVDLLPSDPGRVVEFSYCDNNASEMKRSTRELRQQFENVIAVLPSPLVSTEGLSIVSEYEKLVLVVKAGVTRRCAAGRVIRQIEAAGGTVAGIVLCNRRYPLPQWLYDRI